MTAVLRILLIPAGLKWRYQQYHRYASDNSHSFHAWDRNGNLQTIAFQLLRIQDVCHQSHQLGEQSRIGGSQHLADIFRTLPGRWARWDPHCCDCDKHLYP